MRIDHVIWGTSDLDATAERLAAIGEGLLGWALQVDAVGPVAARLGTQITTITREGLSARLTGVAESMAEPCLPFFLERDTLSADPGAGGDTGGITWVEVAGDRARIEAWLGGADLPVRVRDGEPALVGVGIGDRELR